MKLKYYQTLNSVFATVTQRSIRFIAWLTKFHLPWKKNYTALVLSLTSPKLSIVWHSGLLYKLKLILPSHYYLILKSYLEDWFFSVRVGSSFSSPTEIKAGVPQGAVIAPLLFNLYISDQPTSSHTLVGDFSNDKAILATSPDPILASSYIQDHLFSLESWGVKMNETKSIHGTLHFVTVYAQHFTSIINHSPLRSAYVTLVYLLTAVSSGNLT
jgi:hypothetical protein